MVVNVFPWDSFSIDEQSAGFITTGIHPWYINEVDVKASMQQIEEWLTSGFAKGVGEAGLDALKGPKQSVQEHVFEEHIKMSEKYSCPLTIHCVRKYNEILTLRKRSRAKQTWIVHGFNSSSQMMLRMVEADIHISLGADLLKKNRKLMEVCRDVPSEYLFLETDDSNVAIEDIYQKVAEIRNITVEELKEVVDRNFRKLGFGV